MNFRTFILSESQKFEDKIYNDQRQEFIVWHVLLFFFRILRRNIGNFEKIYIFLFFFKFFIGYISVDYPERIKVRVRVRLLKDDHGERRL